MLRGGEAAEGGEAAGGGIPSRQRRARALQRGTVGTHVGSEHCAEGGVAGGTDSKEHMRSEACNGRGRGGARGRTGMRELYVGGGRGGVSALLSGPDAE